MNKNVVFLALGVGGLAFFLWKKKSSVSPAVPVSMPGAYVPSQPSQTYPYTAIQAPRVDNANQPWYNNSKSFQGPPTGIQGFAADLGAGASIVHSLSDVWGDVADFFPSQPDNTLDASDEFEEYEEEAS